MADNQYKREIINMAISVLREGRTSVAGQFHSSIDDSVFADYTTAGTKDLERAVFQYPLVLKELIRDIQPDFATQFADLGKEILINKEIADFGKLFETPDDFLDIVAQVNEANRKKEYDNEVMLFDSYAHVVVGTDDQAWKCIVAHTAAAANKPITGASYTTNWELYNTDKSFGATWVTAWSYKASQDGRLLLTNEYSNADGDSAYIEYLAYAYAGISDKPLYYPDAFKRAFAVRLASALTKDVEKQVGLLQRYAKYERPEVWDNKDKKRFKGVITPNRTIAVARENLQIK